MSLKGRLSVAATSLLIGVVYASLWWTLVDRLVVVGLILFVLLHFPLLLFAWCFIKTINSNPGFVPYNWV